VSATHADPQFDLSEAVPELKYLRTLAEKGDWNGVSETLAEFGVPNEDQLAAAAAVVVNVPGIERLLDDVVRREPGNVGARSLRAYRAIVMAWEVRSRLSAEHVSEAQFAEFHRLLTVAETELIELCALVPWMGLPWALRLLTGRGLGLRVSENRRRYDRLAAFHPNHFAGQQELLQTLCPKWYGTWEEAFAFARECAAAAPAGSASHSLVAIAHFERWVTLAKPEADRYFADTVVSEVRTAARRSVLDPEFGSNLNGIRLHSLFAAVFSVAGDQDEARRHFELLGPNADSSWVGYLGGEAAATFRQQRATALAKGRVA